MLSRDSKSNSGLVQQNQYKSYCVYLWGFIAKSNLNIVINLQRCLKTTIRKLVDLFQNNLYNTAYNNYSDYVLQDFMSMVCSMYELVKTTLSLLFSIYFVIIALTFLHNQIKFINCRTNLEIIFNCRTNTEINDKVTYTTMPISHFVLDHFADPGCSIFYISKRKLIIGFKFQKQV